MPRNARAPQDPIATPTPEDVAAMKAVATNQRDRMMVHCAFRLGVRVTELLSIKVVDLLLQRQMVKILSQKKRMRRRCPSCSGALAKRFKRCPECGADVAGAVAEAVMDTQERTVPVDKETVALLRAYIKAAKLGPQDRLFKMTRQSAWKIFTDLAEKAGVPPIINDKGKIHKVSPHQMRHGHATVSLKRDNSPLALQRLQQRLGHADISTTMRYVAQDIEGQVQDVDDIFGGEE